jgi:hypothetical protein
MEGVYFELNLSTVANVYPFSNGADSIDYAKKTETFTSKLCVEHCNLASNVKYDQTLRYTEYRINHKVDADACKRKQGISEQSPRLLVRAAFLKSTKEAEERGKCSTNHEPMLHKS